MRARTLSGVRMLRAPQQQIKGQKQRAFFPSPSSRRKETPAKEHRGDKGKVRVKKERSGKMKEKVEGNRADYEWNQGCSKNSIGGEGRKGPWEGHNPSGKSV